MHEIRNFIFPIMKSSCELGRPGSSKFDKPDKEWSEGLILTKNWWTQIVDGLFVLSLWVSMRRDLLSGDATFKKFYYVIKITFTLFHFCPGNCVGTWENKQHFIER